jgi:hypothetical protein
VGQELRVEERGGRGEKVYFEQGPGISDVRGRGVASAGKSH